MSQQFKNSFKKNVTDQPNQWVLFFYFLDKTSVALTLLLHSSLNLQPVLLNWKLGSSFFSPFFSEDKWIKALEAFRFDG